MKTIGRPQSCLFCLISVALRLCVSAFDARTVAALIALFLQLSAGAADLTQIDVFNAGDDGYHTYRIPALVTTKSGALIAICEGRKTGRGDHGDVDLVQKRSTDSGKTWGPLELVHEEEGGILYRVR